MKKNVLVFPCGSEIALEVFRSLQHSIHFHLFGANSVEDHGKFVYGNYIGNVPFYTAENFIPVMQEMVKQNAIDYIIPTMDSVIAKLKENEAQLACKVIASCAETTKICLSKKRTYEVLKDVVRVPKLFHKEDAIPYPVFCKPEVGYSAKNTKYITDKAMLLQHLKEHPECLILEYLPGEEYTLDCFTDARGKLRFCGPRIRKRIGNGISVNTVPVKETGEFFPIADSINQKMEFQGAWFIQLKRAQNGELVLLEIASRMGGSSALYRARGINFTQLSLFDAMGIPIEILDNGYFVELDRALGTSYKIDIEYDEIFIDWDDTIILEGCFYNPDVIKFLYLSKNRKKKITLLSSHEGDLDGEVERFGLRHLFDRILHISKREDKADFIDREKAIFIDDAFSERKKVFQSKHIPVFSVDMIEMLI